MATNYLCPAKSLSVAANTTISLPNGSFLLGIYAPSNVNTLITLNGIYTIFFGSGQPCQFTVPVPISSFRSSAATTIIYS